MNADARGFKSLKEERGKRGKSNEERENKTELARR